MTDVKIKSMNKKFSESVRTAVPDLLSIGIWAFAAFAAANTMMFGKLAPFGVAAASAARKNNSVGAAFGALLGYIFSPSPENNLRYIGAVLIVFGMKLVFERFAKSESASVLMAAGAMGFSSFGYAAMTVISGYSAISAFAETVIAAGTAYFFCRSGYAFEHGKPIVTLSGGDRACIIMSAAILSASLTGITFGKLNLGGIAASVMVLLAARFGKESGGAIAGVAAGTVLSFSAGDMSTALSGYAVGGLVSGIFAPLGKFGCAVVFVAARLIFCLIGAEFYPDYVPVYESVIAAAVTVLIPEGAGKIISSVTFGEGKAADSATVKELVLSKIGCAADGLLDISAATKRVAKAVERENHEGMSTVLNFAAEENCRLCSKNSECWKKKYSETSKAFYEMGAAAKENRKPENEKEFLERCPKTEALFNNVKFKYKEAAKKNAAERKIRNLREVVTDQFEGMALLLRDIAADAADVKSVDKKLSLAVKNAFELRNIPPYACSCYHTSDGCMKIEVSAAKERLKKADISAITEELSDICECDFAKPVKRDTENARRLYFCENPLMEPRFAEYSINAEGEKFCGDSAEHFIDRGGSAHMILSDGMGSGEHAALDSMMTSGLIARMIRAGFRFGPAIKLVNSALLLKSEDESLATADAFSINLYTGAANFYKAGAETSFVLKKGIASKVESISLPVGILGGAEFEQNSMYLGAGDIVVLVTDGVTASGSDWIPSELKSLSEKSAEEIAEGIAKTAFERRTDGHSDDITVVVMKLVSTY
ncbi:MAG: SpoIIE family protein phosphatase [Oscillospiraceae bacterium]|nr:SpoIIE family protein phosphatase [Oscillospiraceae bacterium]